MRHRPKAIICVSAIVILSLLAGCRQDPAPTPSSGGGTVAVTSAGTSAQVEDTIRALGTVRSAQTLPLSFGAGGPVRALSVRVGTEVRAGDALAEIDVTALALELKGAGQQVAYWKATRDLLLDGPDQAQVDRAEAEHAQQLVEAELALEMARQRLEQAQRQDDADIVIARAQLQQFEVQLAQGRAQSPAAQVTIAQVGLERARDVLAAAQDEYGKALDRPWEPQEIRDALVKEVQRAQWNIQVAQAQLEDAERAQRAHALGVEALGTQRAALQAQLDRALAAQEGHADTLSLLSTEVSLAQARLESLQSWQNPLLDPPLPAQVAQVEAQLAQAQLAFEQLEWQIDRAVLRAPFSGVIAAVYARPGEWVASGAPVVDLVDTSSWIVETRNVSELTIGQVRIGQRALVQVLALDKAEIEGTVDTISPVAVVQQGDTTYTLAITLETTDLNLRPGMNVQVEIDTR